MTEIEEKTIAQFRDDIKANYDALQTMFLVNGETVLNPSVEAFALLLIKKPSLFWAALALLYPVEYEQWKNTAYADGFWKKLALNIVVPGYSLVEMANDTLKTAITAPTDALRDVTNNATDAVTPVVSDLLDKVSGSDKQAYNEAAFAATKTSNEEIEEQAAKYRTLAVIVLLTIVAIVCIYFFVK